MKAKYLFYSLALASAFTACTQEELFEAPALESNDVADRPVVGAVTFVGDEVESRYNSEAGTFEVGDDMGVYLMDSFNKAGENKNANYTYWDWQSCWWKMYTMENYISTNYGYEYEGNGKWVNRSSQLVEGNYVALFPKNDKATNRRDLWHPINGVVNMVAASNKDRYYVGRDNQFFVGYEQIKRNQEAEDANGNLNAQISMKPILNYGRIYFDNNESNQFIIKKVVFRNSIPTQTVEGEIVETGSRLPLPNVAYVRPAGNTQTSMQGIVETKATTAYGHKILDRFDVEIKAPWWAFSDVADIKDGLVNGCNDGVVAWTKYDRSTFTHEAARRMVEFESTSNGYVPYGMTAAQKETIYEYVFNFPGEGVLLEGNNEDDDLTICGMSIALPYVSQAWWNQLDIVVYVDRWNTVKNAWEAGCITEKHGLTGSVNGNWNLKNLSLWDNDKEKDFDTVTLEIDNDYFTALEEYSISTSKDFYDLVKGRLTNPNATAGMDMIVRPYGNGLVIGEDVVELIDKFEADHGDVVNITFKNATENAPVILAAENSIHKFAYNNSVVKLAADQTVSTEITATEITKLVNDGASTLTVKAKLADVENNGTMVVTSEVIDNNTTLVGDVTTLTNNGGLTLEDRAVVGTLNNEPAAEVTVTASAEGKKATVTTLNNKKDDTCTGACVQAKLNVDGYLRVETLLANEAIVNVNNKLIVAGGGKFNNISHVHGVEKTVANNKGEIYLENRAEFSNHAVMNLGDAEGATGNVKVQSNDAYVYNYATINAYKGVMDKLNNYVGHDAMLNIHSQTGISVQTTPASEGKIVYKGVANGNIGRLEGKDTKVFEIQESQEGIETKELINMMKTAGAKVIWTKYDIVLTNNMSSALATYAANVTELQVRGSKTEVKIAGEDPNTEYIGTYKNLNITFEKTDSKLELGNNTILRVNSVGGNKQAHSESGSKLLNASGQTFSNVVYH